MPCTFRLLPPRAGKCWLFRARERTRHVLRQVFIVGNGLVAARKMVRATPADEAHASGLSCCLHIAACRGATDALGLAIVPTGRLLFGRCGSAPIARLLRQTRGRAQEHQHADRITRSGQPARFIHRTVASKREHRFVRRGFYMWVLCCVSIERASHESFAPCCHRSNVCRHLQRLDAVRCSTDGDAA